MFDISTSLVFGTKLVSLFLACCGATYLGGTVGNKLATPYPLTNDTVVSQPEKVLIVTPKTVTTEIPEPKEKINLTAPVKVSEPKPPKKVKPNSNKSKTKIVKKTPERPKDTTKPAPTAGGVISSFFHAFTSTDRLRGF